MPLDIFSSLALNKRIDHIVSCKKKHFICPYKKEEHYETNL